MELRPALAVSISLALAACGPPRTPTPPGGDHPPDRAANEPTSSSVAARARAFLDAQLASLVADTPGDHARLLAHFDPSASVLGEGRIDRAIPNLRAGILALDPHDEVLGAKVASLVAGGDDRAVWLAFELAIEVKAWESVGDQPAGSTLRRTVRGSQLITAASGWKAVAAAFSAPGEPEPRQPAAPIDVSTPPGPLTVLAADPAAAARALRDDPAVAVVGFGSADRALGVAASRALLARLAERKPVLHGAPREVRGDSWGFVHAQVDLPIAGEALPARAAVQLLALPDAGGGWSVVAVHLSAL